MPDTTTTTTKDFDGTTTTTTPPSPPPKPGIKTTEFWLGLLAKLIGSAYATGLIGDGTTAARIAGLAVVILAYLGYTVNRGLVKAAAAFLLVGLIGGTTLTACSTISSDVKAFESGAVACAKADSAQAKALGLQLGVDALAGFLAGQDAETVWAKVAADAEAGAKTQGIAVGACAFDGVIADVEKILHPTTPGTATSALVAATAVDPLAAGRAALAAFERAHGVTSVMR